MQLSVNFSIRGGGNSVKLLGEIISAFSPRYRSSPQMGEWTRRDSNPLVSRFARDFGCRLPLRSRLQSASTLTESCATVCTTGPVGSFASRGDRCKDASHNSFGRFQIGKAGQHAENEVNVPSVPEFFPHPFCLTASCRANTIALRLSWVFS